MMGDSFDDAEALSNLIPEDDEDPKALTVAQLIEKLRTFDPALPVITEGCDCHGLAVDVDITKKGDEVIITRDPVVVKQKKYPF